MWETVLEKSQRQRDNFKSIKHYKEEEMKKILSLLMVLLLATTSIVFATGNEQGTTETDSPSAQTEYGLYFQKTGTEDYSSSIDFTFGQPCQGNFYFYNGKYTKVDIGSLTPSDGIKLELKEYRPSPEVQGELVISVSSKKTGNLGTISYSDGDKTYGVNVKSSLPYFGLYTSSRAGDDTYVWGLCDYDVNQEYYILSTDVNITITKVVSVGYYYNQDFVEVPFNYNETNKTVSWTHRKANSYSINIECMNGENALSTTVSVRNQRDLTGVVYGDDYITFGIAMPNEQNNLSITNEYSDYTRDYSRTKTYVLAAGKLYGPNAIVAESEIYDSISNVSINVNAVDMTDDDYSVSISDTKISAFERMVYPVTLNFNPNAKGRIDITISFDLKMPNGEIKKVSTFQQFSLIEEKKIELNLEANDDIQTILSSYDNLKNHFSTVDFDDTNSIKVYLPDGGSFTGTLNIDMGTYNTHNGKQFELTCTGENRYTINGGVDIKGGYITFSGIRFNSTDAEDDVAIKATAPKNSHSTGYVYNCEFNNYDYAIRSIDRGYIMSVDSSVFRNCKYGYYIDCHGIDTSMSRAYSQYNKFVNCKNAIVMMSAPSNALMFSWRFINNEFYNDDADSYDFVVGESNGVLYCQENYYGISENNVSDASNLRSARVNYTNTTGTEVVTNPCVRYYNSVFRLGIDPADGLYTRIFSGRASQINSADLNNLKEIGIAGNDGQKLIGKLNFGE